MAIMEKVDNMQEFMDTVRKEVDKKESRRNARNQKQCNRNKYKMANKYIRRVNITCNKRKKKQKKKISFTSQIG